MKIPYKAVLQVSITILASAFAVMILYCISPAINRKSNGFSRTWRPVLEKEAVISNTDSITAICGATATSWYFSGPGHRSIAVTNALLGNKKYLGLEVDFTPKHSYYFAEIDSPCVLLYFGNDHCVATGNIHQGKLKAYSWFGRNFSRGAAISPASVMLRGFDLGRQVDQVFYKVRLADSVSIKADSILPRRGDAGFSSDGLLHYDRQNALLCYVSFYSNDVVVFDTTFSRVRHFRTIDATFGNNAVQAVREKEHLYLVTDKTKLVNLYSTVHGGRLYNLSLLKADNEQEAQFSGNVVVDSYDISTGAYAGSFYIPDQDGEKALQFEVYGKRLAAVYKGKIVVYAMGQAP